MRNSTLYAMLMGFLKYAADEMNHTPHHWSYLQMLEHPYLQIASQISPLFAQPGNMRHRSLFLHALLKNT